MFLNLKKKGMDNTFYTNKLISDVLIRLSSSIDRVGTYFDIMSDVFDTLNDYIVARDTFFIYVSTFPKYSFLADYKSDSISPSERDFIASVLPKVIDIEGDIAIINKVSRFPHLAEIPLDIVNLFGMRLKINNKKKSEIGYIYVSYINSNNNNVDVIFKEFLGIFPYLNNIVMEIVKGVYLNKSMRIFKLLKDMYFEGYNGNISKMTNEMAAIVDFQYVFLLEFNRRISKINIVSGRSENRFIKENIEQIERLAINAKNIAMPVIRYNITRSMKSCLLLPFKYDGDEFVLFFANARSGCIDFLLPDVMYDYVLKGL